jgi:porphobilinogen synthase
MSFPVHRPRRLRIDSRLRGMIRDVSLSPENLIYPLFVVDELDEPHEISAMPGQKHWPVTRLHEPVADAVCKGVVAFILFGVPSAKDAHGSHAYDGDSVVCRALRHIRRHCPQAYLITDVCLCAYTDHGHCGVLRDDGSIDNDSSIDLIARMALAHAQAGADMVAPSDMMDGRIGAIRTLLDTEGFADLPIMAYSAKYASAFYGPFREAAGSAPG